MQMLFARDANKSTRRLVEDGMSTGLTNTHTARGFSFFCVIDRSLENNAFSVLHYVIKCCLTLYTKGCICLGKSKSGFPNPKTDHESVKSTLRVDSSDQIQIQIFEIHNFGKGFLKCIFGKRFFWKRNGTEQMPNMYDPEPMLVTTY